MNPQPHPAPVARGRLLRAVPVNVLNTCTLGAFCTWLKINRGLIFTNYQELWRWSITDLEAFWGSLIEFFHLDVGQPQRILDNPVLPGARWLPGANLSYAAHALRYRGNQTAVVGISQTRRRTSLSRDELYRQVACCAEGLRRLGVQRGDCVAGYLPNIPEAIVAFLATSALGAIWVSCAPEFGAKAVTDRLQQVQPKVLLAVAGYTYGQQIADRRDAVTAIRAAVSSITRVVDVPYQAGLTHTDALPWEALCSEFSELRCEQVDADHPLYILFSSGTTGLPKAIVHSHGGILLEHFKALGLHNDVKEWDRFFWFSTTGWMVWNYSVSALLMGAQVICFDGNPLYPDSEALWKIAADEQVTFFGNSATFYMHCRNSGIEPARHFRLDPIRTLGSTGSALPAEGFEWLASQFGSDRVISSAAGGTDICSAFVGASPMVAIRAGEIAAPMLGCDITALNEQGQPVLNEPGELVIRTPMPSMPVQLWGDSDNRMLHAAYFEKNPGLWTHGDWITIFDDGASVISGRSDSTLNRGGVRLGTADFYSVVEEIAGISDSMVVHLEGQPGSMGELILFVVATAAADHTRLQTEINQSLRRDHSPRHIPDTIVWISAIPRTLTGKKLEAPVKKLLQGSSLDKVASPEALLNAHGIQEILAWYTTRQQAQLQPLNR
jgi:acetoacetyl-CoA synthetase